MLLAATCDGIMTIERLRGRKANLPKISTTLIEEESWNFILRVQSLNATDERIVRDSHDFWNDFLSFYIY